MALPPTPSADDWSEEIAEAAREEFNGEISVVRPGTSGSWGAGVGVTGGTEGATVLSRRSARIQHLRQPIEMSSGNGWETKRRIRVQCDILTGDPDITKGLLVKIWDGGRDPSLTGQLLQVTSAVNSSHAAVRTIEAVSELGDA